MAAKYSIARAELVAGIQMGEEEREALLGLGLGLPILLPHLSRTLKSLALYEGLQTTRSATGGKGGAGFQQVDRK